MAQTSEVTDISVNTVLSLHKETIANYKTNDNIIEIINIIGGIDKVLDDYLTSVETELSSQQLFMIHQILSSSKSIPSPSKSIIAIHHENNNNPNNVYYTFSDKDTFLHCYFGNKNAEKVLSILQNKFLQILIILSIFLYIYFRQTSWSKLLSIYIIIINVILWLPFALGWILSTNIKGFKLITRTFEVSAVSVKCVISMRIL